MVAHDGGIINATDAFVSANINANSVI